MNLENVISILWIQVFQNMVFRKMASRLQVIVFLKLIKSLSYYIYIYIYKNTEWDYQNQLKKPFNFLSHCKVSCDSTCCAKICGEDNHCILISIHTKTLPAIAMNNK